MILLCAAIALSGCSAGEAAQGPGAEIEQAKPADPSDVKVSGSSGGIVGVVVDESLWPLAGANVTLETATSKAEELARAVTTEAGEFAFSLLEPGTYRVRAHYEGYGQGTALATVIAEEVATARITVTSRPTVEAYVDLFIERGILKCAYSYVVFADSCGVTEVFGESVNEIDFNVSAGHQFLVSETNWEHGGVTMDHDFYARNESTKPRGTLIGRGYGQPVLRVDFWPEKVYIRPGIDAPTVFPASSETLVFRIGTYYDGQLQKEANDGLSPLCPLLPLLGYCTGVGVEFDFIFSQYVTVFMNAVPETLEDYSAIPDM